MVDSPGRGGGRCEQAARRVEASIFSIREMAYGAHKEGLEPQSEAQLLPFSCEVDKAPGAGRAS